MPVREGPPPPFDWEKLGPTAHIDFFTVHQKRRAPLPKLQGEAKWSRPAGSSTYRLTIHDPTLSDVQSLVLELGNPPLVALELAVDLRPKGSIDAGEREQLLLKTFNAVAGRFRPEDATEWGYGKRGTVNAQGAKLRPFHTRFPSPDEQLIYGHRGDFMQAKAYFKRVDQKRALPLEQYCVRMELALRRGALMDPAFGLLALNDLVAFPYRKAFARHFRIIDRPEIRKRKNRSAASTAKLAARMNRAWETAGVGKFAPEVHELPPETSVTAKKQIAARAQEQLPKKDFVLRRDQVSNEKIGGALQQLQRRMMP